MNDNASGDERRAVMLRRGTAACVERGFLMSDHCLAIPSAFSPGPCLRT